MEIDHYGMVATYIFFRCYFVIIHTYSARVFFAIGDIVVGFIFYRYCNKYHLIAIAIFAFTWVLIAASQYHNTLNQNNILLKKLHKQVYLIQGEVINIANIDSDNSRFNFLITHWQGEKVNNSFKVRLSWKEPKQRYITRSDMAACCEIKARTWFSKHRGL